MPTRRGSLQSNSSTEKESTEIRPTVSGLGGAGHPHAGKTNAPKVPKKRGS